MCCSKVLKVSYKVPEPLWGMSRPRRSSTRGRSCFHLGREICTSLVLTFRGAGRNCCNFFRDPWRARTSGSWLGLGVLFIFRAVWGVWASGGPMLCGQRRGNLETVTLFHTVWALSELGTDKLAQVAPVTFHRSDEVAVTAMVLCSISIQVNQITDIDWGRGRYGANGRFGPLTVWMVLKPSSMLLQDKSLVSNWYLLVSELVSMGPNLSRGQATGTNSCI